MPSEPPVSSLLLCSVTLTHLSEFSWMMNSIKQQMWVKKQPFFLSCSSDRSGLCFSVQCSPTSLRAGRAAGRRPAGPQQEAQQGRGKGAAKAPLGSAALPLSAKPRLWWCDALVLTPSDPTVTMFMASRWVPFNSTDCNICGWWVYVNVVPGNEKFVWPLHYLASVLNLLTSIETHCSP